MYKVNYKYDIWFLMLNWYDKKRTNYDLIIMITS